MKVIIDDQVYVPASALHNADATAQAIIRAMINTYYGGLECHVDGYEPKSDCDCSACHLHRIAVQFVGRVKSEEETDPGFAKLWKATE